MQPPTDFRKLSDDEWREFQRRADQFADAVNSGGSISWATYLAGLTGNLRTAVLHEFVKIDLEASWKKGVRIFLDDYLRRYPELGSPYDLPAHLVYEEYRVRAANGDAPEPETYLTRYPHLAETLRGFFGTPGTSTKRDVSVRKSQPVDQSVAFEKEKEEPNSQSMLPAVGQYQLLEMLGKGQFGEVWRAKAPGGVEVAVKVISQPSDRETARRELQALELVKNLRHPTLMATLAFWEHQQKVYIVVELAEGTLRDRMKECKTEGKDGIPPEELINYIGASAEGLDFLHSKSVFHRDVKPDNILIASGHAKVADFGLARAQDRPDMSVSFAGTPVYMAPEVWGGKFSARSDQYSLAVTYAELRLGRRPLDGKDFVELMSRQLDEPPDLKGLPPAEKTVLAKALAKQPDKRYESCVAFAEALYAAIHGPAGGGGGRRGVPVWLVIVGVVVLIGAAVGGYLAFGPKGDTKPTTPEVKPPEEKKPEDKKPEDKKPEDKKPAADPIRTPAGYQAVAGTEARPIENMKYATKITRVPDDASPIPGPVPTFILIAADGVKPFYIQETKAWNGLLMWSAGPGSSWADKGDAAVAVRVSFPHAVACARKLGGRLPTPAEWDAAAGHPARIPGAGLVKEGKPQVNSREPGSVVDPGRDVNAAGVANLAGSGREWTAGLAGDDGWKPLPDLNPKANDLIVLRGRSFTLARALTFEDLDYEQKVPQTQYAGKASPYTSFRVVLDLPK